MLTFIRYIYAKLKYQRKFKTALQLFQVKDEKSTPSQIKKHNYHISI